MQWNIAFGLQIKEMRGISEKQMVNLKVDINLPDWKSFHLNWSMKSAWFRLSYSFYRFHHHAECMWARAEIVAVAFVAVALGHLFDSKVRRRCFADRPTLKLHAHWKFLSIVMYFLPLNIRKTIPLTEIWCCCHCYSPHRSMNVMRHRHSTVYIQSTKVFFFSNNYPKKVSQKIESAENVCPDKHTL